MGHSSLVAAVVIIMWSHDSRNSLYLWFWIGCGHQIYTPNKAFVEKKTEHSDVTIIWSSNLGKSSYLQRLWTGYGYQIWTAGTPLQKGLMRFSPKVFLKGGPVTLAKPNISSILSIITACCQPIWAAITAFRFCR